MFNLRAPLTTKAWKVCFAHHGFGGVRVLRMTLYPFEAAVAGTTREHNNITPLPLFGHCCRQVYVEGILIGDCSCNKMQIRGSGCVTGNLMTGSLGMDPSVVLKVGACTSPTATRETPDRTLHLVAGLPPRDVGEFREREKKREKGVPDEVLKRGNVLCSVFLGFPQLTSWSCLAGKCQRRQAQVKKRIDLLEGMRCRSRRGGEGRGRWR